MRNANDQHTCVSIYDWGRHIHSLYGKAAYTNQEGHRFQRDDLDFSWQIDSGFVGSSSMRCGRVVTV